MSDGKRSLPLPLRPGMDVYSAYQDKYIGSVLGVARAEGYFTVRPGRLNLGPLTPSLRIPFAAVRSISMERIILDTRHDQPRQA